MRKIIRFMMGIWKRTVVWPRFKYTAGFYGWLKGCTCEIHKSCRFKVPVRVMGFGNVKLGAGVVLGNGESPRTGNGEILIQSRSKDSNIVIGDNTIISNNVSIISCQDIVIGSDCLIGDHVSVFDCDLHLIDPEKRRDGIGKCKSVEIGKNVWLGSGVRIMKGVKIGDHSVVGAGSIVTVDVPGRSLFAGVPARLIRKI